MSSTVIPGDGRLRAAALRFDELMGEAEARRASAPLDRLKMRFVLAWAAGRLELCERIIEELLELPALTGAKAPARHDGSAIHDGTISHGG